MSLIIKTLLITIKTVVLTSFFIRDSLISFDPFNVQNLLMKLHLEFRGIITACRDKIKTLTGFPTIPLSPGLPSGPGAPCGFKYVTVQQSDQ